MTRQLIRTHRLLLEPTATGNRSVDGRWWPRSNDLAAELPDLLAELADRLGTIHRVVYHLDEWATAPRKLDSAGHQVRLDGYRHQPRRTVNVLGVTGGRVTLLVVPPFAEGAEADAAQQLWDSEGGAGYY